MQIARDRFLFSLFMFALLGSHLLLSQNSKAILAGTVKDESGAILQGARITLEPAVQPASSNGQGAFFFNSLTPGSYKVTVSFVGFGSVTK